MYKEYLDEITNLEKLINLGDKDLKETARLQRKQAGDLADSFGALEIEVQEIARHASTEYTEAVNLLKGRPLDDVGFSLPVKVRPSETLTTGNLSDFVSAQSNAAKELQRTVNLLLRGLETDKIEAARLKQLLDTRREALNTIEVTESPEHSREPGIGATPLRKDRTPRLRFAAALAIGILILFGSLTLGVAFGEWGWASLIGVLVIAAGLLWISKTKVKSVGSGLKNLMPLKPLKTESPGTIVAATKKGRMTGFEPHVLDGYEMPQSNMIHGSPGLGLASAKFEVNAIKAGQIGEINFAKALSKQKLLTRFHTFWSLHMLGTDTYSKEEYDVDCAIVTGDRVWLVDLKYYASGDVTYTSEDGIYLKTIDNETGAFIGAPKKMSRNMSMALERFRKRYKNYSYPLEARVVLIPTKNGEGYINDVSWPGGIPLVTLTQFLSELSQESDFEQNLNSEMIVRTFSGLVKEL
ncbi:nuclease-related domain-containing protein [Corynebacterium casei]|uniref:nuclease-related domain-containing protein n=1 Tax=Corynebacterium casei TaxID=160386 RepID=UPI003FD4E6FA